MRSLFLASLAIVGILVSVPVAFAVVLRRRRRASNRVVRYVRPGLRVVKGGRE